MPEGLSVVIVGAGLASANISVEGSLRDFDFIVRYRRNGRLLAAAAMGRGGDPESNEPGELRSIADEIRAAPRGPIFRSGHPLP